MSVESIKKKGYLYKLPVKGLVKKWNRRWFVLHGTSREGAVRIEYFDNQSCEFGGQSKRTIPLKECSSLSEMVGNKIHPYVFQFKSPLGQHIFASDNQVDMDEWVDAIKEAVEEDRAFRKRRRQPSQTQTPIKSESKHTSGPVQKTFRVTLEENDTTKRMNLQGAHDLIVGHTSLTLVNVSTGNRVATWHFKELKNYGKQTGQFYFEIGQQQHSSNHPGVFVCLSTNFKDIFTTVSINIKTLRANPQKSHLQHQRKPPVQTPQHKEEQASVPGELAPVKSILHSSQLDHSPKEGYQAQHEHQTAHNEIEEFGITSSSDTKQVATVKYSVIAAGGGTKGRSGVTGPTSYLEPYNNSAIYDDDEFSFGSFESFDTFDSANDTLQQQISEVVNPLSKDPQVKSTTSQSIPMTSESDHPDLGIQETPEVETPEINAESNEGIHDPNITSISNASEQLIIDTENIVEEDSIAGTEKNCNTNIPQESKPDSSTPKEETVSVGPVNDTRLVNNVPLLADITDNQHSTAQNRLTGDIHDLENASLDLMERLHDFENKLGEDFTDKNEADHVTDEKAFELFDLTAFDLDAQIAELQSPSGPISDIANFDLEALLQNTPIDEPLVEDISPEKFATLDLSAFDTDFLHDIQQTPLEDPWKTLDSQTGSPVHMPNEPQYPQPSDND